MSDNRELYNIVTIRNIDNEDFIFRVDNQPYVIRAGETRNFPKFMATLAVKHLIDRLLIKQREDGAFLGNADMRENLAGQIVMDEQTYEKPVVPTDDEIVEDMNKTSDIDNVLKRNRMRLQEKPEEAALIPPPAPVMPEVEVPKPVKPTEKSAKKEKKEEETFAGLEIPSREEMMSFAKNTLKIDISDKKTVEAWSKMTDKELYDDLGIANA